MVLPSHQTSLQLSIEVSRACTMYVPNANKAQFKLDPQRHYYAAMNHDCQKHNEEDIVACILDVMEVMGWTFRFSI